MMQITRGISAIEALAEEPRLSGSFQTEGRCHSRRYLSSGRSARVVRDFGGKPLKE